MLAVALGLYVVWFCVVVIRFTPPSLRYVGSSGGGVGGPSSSSRMSWRLRDGIVDDPKSRPNADTNADNNTFNLPRPLPPWSVDPSSILPLRAVLEPPARYWHNTTTASDSDSSFGRPVAPLPLRTHDPSALTTVEYPRVRTCRDLPSKLPVIRGPAESSGRYDNVYNKKPLLDPFSETLHCPVDADAFLPWIHDLFPAADGSVVHVVAQNKRRCNQNHDVFRVEIERLEPQVALLQGVSVTPATDVPPELWDDDALDEEPRWRLSTAEEAPAEGAHTRLLCRFRAVDPTTGAVSVLGTTLSVFPVPYELAHVAKGYGAMLSKKGQDKGYFWLSNARFDCPVPNVPRLRAAIRDNAHVRDDRTVVYLDVVPIRTPPRVEGEGVHLPFLDNAHLNGRKRFDAKTRWGDRHVLPRVEASGRWENLPVCQHYGNVKRDEETKKEEEGGGSDHTNNDHLTSDTKDTNSDDDKKPHVLVGCIWASAVYKTRGNQVHVDDTRRRLLEWIEFHLAVGFDHFYVYDNSAAHANYGDHDLRDVLDVFPPSRVTRVEWPFRVCNNNLPANVNTGERSSQYAAEADCLVRYGPTSEWIANFDPDEYLVPAAGRDNLRSVLKEAAAGGTHILSFRSARAKLNRDHLVPGSCGFKRNPEAQCLNPDPNRTILQTYNCDLSPPPKPNQFDRAKKQIYRPDYVLSHFVHYSTVTRPMVTPRPGGRIRYRESPPAERFVDERTEAFMLHAKTTGGDVTHLWEDRCRKGYQRVPGGGDQRCKLGIPFPEETAYVDVETSEATDENGHLYNCWAVKEIEERWAPMLERAMEERRRTRRGETEDATTR